MREGTAPGVHWKRKLRLSVPRLSSRSARRGACWPLRDRARPLRPTPHALQRARACSPLLRTPCALVELERHECGAHPDRGQSDSPARSCESPPCLLRSRDARSEPTPCSSHFTMLTLVRRRCLLAGPKPGGARGAAAASRGLGSQAAHAASRCGPLVSMPVTEDDPAPLPSIKEFPAEMPAPAVSASHSAARVCRDPLLDPPCFHCVGRRRLGRLGGQGVSSGGARSGGGRLARCGAHAEPQL